jgi:hypothetical protein
MDWLYRWQWWFWQHYLMGSKGSFVPIGSFKSIDKFWQMWQLWQLLQLWQ